MSGFLIFISIVAVAFVHAMFVALCYAAGLKLETHNPFSRGLGLGQRTPSAASSPRSSTVGWLPLLSVLVQRVFVRITRRGSATARASLSRRHQHADAFEANANTCAAGNPFAGGRP